MEREGYIETRVNNSLHKKKNTFFLSIKGWYMYDTNHLAFLNIIQFFFYASDINECTTKSYSCHADAVCHNNKGSYKCVCKTGYVGDGKKCQREGRYQHHKNFVNLTQSVAYARCRDLYLYHKFNLYALNRFVKLNLIHHSWCRKLSKF